MERFGEKLRTLRTRKGLSLRQLGSIIGVDHSFLGRIEQGHKTPNAMMILKIAEFFDVPIDLLMKDYLELD